jgi:hypothetical protein
MDRRRGVNEHTGNYLGGVVAQGACRQVGEAEDVQLVLAAQLRSERLGTQGGKGKGFENVISTQLNTAGYCFMPRTDEGREWEGEEQGVGERPPAAH